MSTTKQNTIFTPLMLVTIFSIIACTCGIIPGLSKPDQDSSPIEEEVTPEIEVATSVPTILPPDETMTSSGEVKSPWFFELSRVLTQKEAEEYLSPLTAVGYEINSLGYGDRINPQEGWQVVVVEMAATANGFQQVSGCPFKVILMDSGGYERPAEVGIGYSGAFSARGCTGKTLLPPGGRMKVIAYTEIPKNQEPSSITIKERGFEAKDLAAFEVGEVNPVDFAVSYNHPDWPTMPDEAKLEILDTARITFNFAGAYLVDSEDPMRLGSQLFVPAKVENIGGFNLEIEDFDWEQYVKVFGFDSEGNIAGNSTGLWTMRRLQDDYYYCCPPIPPGQSAEYDVHFIYWPRSTKDLQWMWIGISMSNGESSATQYQLILQPPNVLGLYNPQYPSNPESMEWFNQPPPSQQK